MKAFQRSTHTLFFAYGSNMIPGQIQARCTRPEVLGRARLPGHSVGFFGHSKVWDGAVATVFPTPDRDVWGVLYRLTIVDSDRLDTWQDVRLDGTGSYFHYPTEVVDEDGSSHLVLVYKKESLGEPLAPSRPYLDRIVAGAEERRLPAEYIQGLRAFSAREPAYEVPKKSTFDRSLLIDIGCSGCG
jgi:hypothetical protein